MRDITTQLLGGSPLAQTLDAYFTCELATLTRSGAPVAWPTSGLVQTDGKILLTTSTGFPQKALNVRRDGRVAVLFSDPTASGLAAPAQILVRGTATCPDEIHTAPTGELGRLWHRLFLRQPAAQAYLDWPTTRFTDWYFMRLLITVTGTEVVTRPLPEPGPTAGAGLATSKLLGADVLAGYHSVVLTAVDGSGAPVLCRTTVAAADGGYRVEVPADLPVAEGAAGLLVHRHDEKLSKLHSATVRGSLVADGKGWLLVPARLVEPGGRRDPGIRDRLAVVRNAREATRRYLAHRQLTRPTIPWQAYREIRSTVRQG